jgi:SAM-dependent methyltransferase
MTEPRLIDLRKTKLDGTILDLGGGGEGVISRLFPSQVLALDKRFDELEEAPGIQRALVADGLHLPFGRASFAACTSFFTLMYFLNEDLAPLARELHRVIQPGGRLHLWEPVINSADPFLIDLEVWLPNEIITVGYGVISPGKTQNARQLRHVFSEAGFRLDQENESMTNFEQNWIRV